MKLQAFIASIAATAVLLITTASLADPVQLGDLQIMHVEARATPPGALTSGGYLTIKNTGSTDDTLVGASATFAGKTEVHEMKMQGEVMKMRRLKQGLPIPAGEEVRLESGSYHLMFMRLQQALKPGEFYEGTLVFAKAGEVAVRFEIKAIQGTNHHQHGKSHKAHDSTD